MDKEISARQFSTYAWKSGFQTLLLPLRDRLISHGVSANQITVATVALCVLFSLLFVLQLIVLQMTATLGLILLPFFLLLRMALNALDGMVAKHTNSCSPKGQVFNELGDVIADLFLFGGFLILLSNHIIPWALLMLLGLLIEFTSLALIPALGQRPNQGPFGKSDRAVYLGVLAVLLLVLSQSHWLVQTYIWIGIVLALLTFTNRLNLLEAN